MELDCCRWKMVASISVTLFGLFTLVSALPQHFGPTQESCSDMGVDFNRYFVLESEGVILTCPELSPEQNYSLTWYNNETSEVITADKKQRIHTENDLLWFLPVLLKDTGYYVCVVRYPTSCQKRPVSLTVTNSTSPSCFQNKFFYGSTSFVKISKKITCPDIDEYVTSDEELELRWYKNCEPLTYGEKYIYHKGDRQLTVINVEPSDAGIYVCELQFMHDGLRYRMTRTIDFDVKGCKASVGPKILHPKNGTIEIKPGSKLNISCIAYTGYCDPSAMFVYWIVNDKFVEDHFGNHFQVEKSWRRDREGNYFESTIFFPNFKEEYYNESLTCVAKNGLGCQIATVKFRKTVPDFTKEIVAVFGVFACMLFICICTYKSFKIDIVLWYRDMFPAKCSVDGKKYDAYIIYPQSSCSPRAANILVFIMDILPQVLECQCGYKLFIPGRDDLPGEDYIEQVKRNIKDSRRLIILVTKSSNKQLDTTFEQQVGLYDALIVNQMEVIVIELEFHDDYSDFSESVRHIIQKKGTIKWKNSEWVKETSSLNSKFWKQVRYNMPSRSSRSCRKIEYY